MMNTIYCCTQINHNAIEHHRKVNFSICTIINPSIRTCQNYKKYKITLINTCMHNKTLMKYQNPTFKLKNIQEISNISQKSTWN